MRATELVFVKVVMWVFPALAFILASGVGLLVDGGLPGLPSIYNLESDAITTQQNGLDVLINAKSNRD